MTAYIQKFNKEVLTLPYILGTSSKLKKRSIFPTRLDQDDPRSYSQYFGLDSIRKSKMAAEQ